VERDEVGFPRRRLVGVPTRFALARSLSLECWRGCFGNEHNKLGTPFCPDLVEIGGLLPLERGQMERGWKLFRVRWEGRSQCNTGKEPRELRAKDYYLELTDQDW
jgi:hypothetical protein